MEPNETPATTLTGVPEFSAEVPAPFIYDPLTRQSAPNIRSLIFKGDGAALAMKAAIANGQSFTIEAFVKPPAPAEAPFVRKTYSSDAATEAGLMLDHFRQDHQFYLRGFVTRPKQQPETVSCGYYGSAAQCRGANDTDWRHVALVHDAARNTLTAYVDYYLSGTEPIANSSAARAGRIGCVLISRYFDPLCFNSAATSPSGTRKTSICVFNRENAMNRCPSCSMTCGYCSEAMPARNF